MMYVPSILACIPFTQVWFIDFGLSTMDPTPTECEEEVRQLRNIFAPASPDSGGYMQCRVLRACCIVICIFFIIVVCLVADKSASERWERL